MRCVRVREFMVVASNRPTPMPAPNAIIVAVPGLLRVYVAA